MLLYNGTERIYSKWEKTEIRKFCENTLNSALYLQILKYNNELNFFTWNAFECRLLKVLPVMFTAISPDTIKAPLPTRPNCELRITTSSMSLLEKVERFMR